MHRQRLLPVSPPTRFHHPRVARIWSYRPVPERQRCEISYGGIPRNDVVHVTCHARARFVRIITPITDHPAVVRAMEDLPGGLVAIKDGSLNDRSEIGGKLIAWKWEGQSPEHLGRLLVRRHAAIIARSAIACPGARALAGLRSGDGPLSVRARPSSLKRDCGRWTTSTSGKCLVDVHAKSRLTRVSLRTLRPEDRGQAGACPDRTRAIPCTARAVTGQIPETR